MCDEVVRKWGESGLAHWWQKNGENKFACLHEFVFRRTNYIPDKSSPSCILGQHCDSYSWRMAENIVIATVDGWLKTGRKSFHGFLVSLLWVWNLRRHRFGMLNVIDGAIGFWGEIAPLSSNRDNAARCKSADRIVESAIGVPSEGDKLVSTDVVVSTTDGIMVEGMDLVYNSCTQWRPEIKLQRRIFSWTSRLFNLDVMGWFYLELIPGLER